MDSVDFIMIFFGNSLSSSNELFDSITQWSNEIFSQQTKVNI